ncbi:MAG: VWA domain-containing protein [Methylococcales bacterium]
MSSYNLRSNLGQKTYEGASVPTISAEKQLSRLVLASMLWEKQFYLDGKDHAKLIGDLVRKVSATKVAELALQARSQFKLRHIPLLLTRELARLGKLEASVLTNVIQRADEMGEFLSIYWKDGKSALSNQVKKGLAGAFVKFNEYQLAKNDKNSASVSIRDVMFLAHPKPQSPEQESLFKRVANQELVTPDTWETQLSAGADKKETFSRLMAEKKLGALAFLRNLRNMVDSGVPESEIRAYGIQVDVAKVLPFRYIAAAKIVPQFEDMLEAMMLVSLKGMDKLPGKTVLLVDVSGSMFGCKVSGKSDLDRFDAAAALAMLCKEVCENVEIYTFSTGLARVAPRSGFALREALSNSQQHGGTHLGQALRSLQTKGSYDRVIVFTDEQSQDAVGGPKCDKGYIINVAAYENGVNHSAWTTVSGFSEAVIDYIRESEKE